MSNIIENNSENSLTVDDLETDVGAFGTQEATGVTTDGVVIVILHWLF
jgi:hypothetical protein